MVSVKHVATGVSRKMTRADWDADHITTGTPGKWLRFAGNGQLEEVDPPTAASPDLSGYATTAALTSGLAGKQTSGNYSLVGHSHVIADVTGLQAALDAKQTAGSFVTSANFTWSNLSGKPTTFAPSAHSHVIADVTGLQTALDGKQASGSYVLTSGLTWGNVTGKPTTFPPTAHTHVMADITDLAAALAGKQAVGSYQPAGTYATGTGSASGTNTGDETKATIDAKLVLPNDATKFYSGAGTWLVPPSGGGGAPLSSSAPIGYSTGAGGAVTQATSRVTGVTLSKASGSITLFSKTTTASQVESFVVTNTLVAATDTINVSIKATGIFLAFVTDVAAGSFRISIFTPAATTAQAPIVNFAVIKAVAA